MTSQDQHREADPDERQRDIHSGKPPHAQLQCARPDEDDDGREHIAAPHEEGVDCLLGLVLLLATGWKPQELARGIHDRVVGRVLGSLDPSHDREPGARRDDRIAAERDQRQCQQGSSQSAVLDQSRGDERLQQERRRRSPRTDNCRRRRR